MINVYLLLDYRVHGFYVFSMGFFISYLRQDKKVDVLMVEIAKKWMEQMRIRNTQYIIARHHDTEHPHCHIVFNRIDNDGNLISDNCRNEPFYKTSKRRR